VAVQCRVLRVHRSGYYSWNAEPVSARQKDDDRLVERIKAVHEEFSGSYGSPRICRELRESGETCGENRVAKLMKAHKIKAERRYRRPKHRYSKPSRLTPNRLEQDFDVTGPDRVWVTDITYISTSEGWLYLAVVIDLFSRRVVGWSMGSMITSDLVIKALLNAIWRRRPKSKVIVHSDQGSQFSSDAWNRFCRDHNIERSMSRRGNCYDNAVVESFFSSLKKERIRGKTYLTRDAAHSDIFDYIEILYNRTRRHSKLGMLSPVDFEEVKIGV
jgi:putative transposase